MKVALGYLDKQNCLQYLEKNSFSAGCAVPSWKGDGYCDDNNNNEGCEFDGGDCCGPNVNTQYCTKCECLEEVVGGKNALTLSYAGPCYHNTPLNTYYYHFDRYGSKELKRGVEFIKVSADV